jgi:hypothetical protein
MKSSATRYSPTCDLLSTSSPVEDAGSMFLRNVYKLIPDCTASHHKMILFMAIVLRTSGLWFRGHFTGGEDTTLDDYVVMYLIQCFVVSLSGDYCGKSWISFDSVHKGNFVMHLSHFDLFWLQYSLQHRTNNNNNNNNNKGKTIPVTGHRGP